MSYDRYSDDEHNAGVPHDRHSDISALGTEAIPLRTAAKPPAGVNDGMTSHQRSVSSISSPLPSQAYTSYQNVASPPTAPLFSKQRNHSIRHPDLSQNFNRRNQTIRLFVAALARYLVTLVFVAVLVVALRSYQGSWVFQEQGKLWFNAIMTGLSIAFGVHLAASMKSLAGNIRWYFLAQRFRSLEEANLLLGFDSLSNLLRLVWKSRNRRLPSALIPSILQIFAITWILINVVSRVWQQYVFFANQDVGKAFQVAVALLGLTYSVNTSQHLSLRKAPVAVPNSAVFSWGNSTNVTLEDQQRYAAHSLGLIGSSMYFGAGQTSSYLGPVTDVGNTSARTITKDDQGWTYRMVDSSTDGKTTIITNRTISSSFDCKFYEVSFLGDGGHSDIITVEDWPGIDQIFVGHASPGSSNYLTQVNEDCGDRCTRVQVFQAKDEPGIPDAGFFDCNITIATVEGAYAPEHDLPDQQAKIAAGAIGFGGASNHSDDIAYQVYPNNAYGANSTHGNPVDMGFFLSSFAIQTVASVAAFIPRVNITTGRADSPVEGFGLSVAWHQVIPILASIGGAHLALIIIIITFASRVIVHDDSPLAMARLLKGQVERLGSRGGLKDGRELARELGGMVAYGFREPQDVPGRDMRALAVSEDVDIVRPLRFPSGRYA